MTHYGTKKNAYTNTWQHTIPSSVSWAQLLHLVILWVDSLATMEEQLNPAGETFES